MAKNGKYAALVSIQYGLGFEPKGLPPGAFPKLMESAPINYAFIDDVVIKALEERDIPARGPLPFAALWWRIVENEREKFPHSASWLATLLYAEWGLMVWLNGASNSNIFDVLNKDDYAELEYMKKALGKEDLKNMRIGGPSDLLAKWWLDDLVFRIRAVWDKIPYAIAETTAPNKIELKGNRLSARLNELEKAKNKLGLDGNLYLLADSLINEARNLEYLKSYRDAELHRHARATAEIYGYWEENESLNQIWKNLYPELMRCREGLMGAVGLILLRSTSE